MKRTISEKRALRKLDIPDFRHITKEKIVKLASMLPYMDPEVAKKAIDQFPEFKGMSVEMVNQFRDILNKIVDGNTKSQDTFYNVCNSIIGSLQKELEGDHIDSEERSRIEDKMITVARMIGEKDSENKMFYLEVGGLGLLGILACIFGSVSLLGTNTNISSPDYATDPYEGNDLYY